MDTNIAIDNAVVIAISTTSMVMSMATNTAAAVSSTPAAMAMSMGGSTDCKLSVRNTNVSHHTLYSRAPQDQSWEEPFSNLRIGLVQ